MTPAERFQAILLPNSLDAALSPSYERVLFCITFGSAASILFSIAVSQILLGAGLLLLAVDRRKVDLPPIKLPLGLFFFWTILADLVSGHPVEGLPQIRKFFVFGIVVVVSYAFRSEKRIRLLLVTWCALSLLSALSGFVHVFARREEAIRLHWNTYDYFLDDRITGFASHWMTFGAEQMIVLLMLLAFLLFACPRDWRPVGWCCAGVLWVSLMLGLTRCIFLLGVPIGVVYLLWAFKPWTLALVPLLALVSYVAMPFQVRDRIWSVITPHGDLDSNNQRYIMRRTGWEMIKAHPWFGVGPEQVKPQFEAYVPAGIQRPLPHGWYGHLHNIYLQYAAERGIPALVFLLWMIGKLLSDLTRALRTRALRHRDRYVVFAAVSVMVALLGEGFFEHNLGDSEVLTMFLIVVTCAYDLVTQRNVRHHTT